MVGLCHIHLESLCCSLGVSVGDVDVTELSGGLYGRSFRVSSDRGDWVARLPLGERAHGGLDLSVEQRLLEHLGESGLVPAVVRGHSSDDILITHYLPEAKTWSAADAREADNITRLSERLRDLHRIEHELLPFCATEIAERYQQLAERIRRLNAEQREWGREFVALAREYDAGSHPAVVCHNDLVAANILDDGRLWLIDFEYAVLAEPILDLASLVGMNDFSPDQQKHLVDAYYLGAAPPFGMARFADVVRLVRFVSYFWVLADRRTDLEDTSADRFVENIAAMLR